LGIILIRGSEITREMPPGHHNALFLKDCNALDTKNYMDAFNEAKKQNAFIFWNHPSWWNQQPDTTLWFKEHTELWKNGMMHGIEVVNGSHYSALAHQWCIEKNLTLIGNTDVHNPIGMDYDLANGEHRPMTLVFAKERTEAAIYEALMNRRTAIYYKNKLIGDESYLKPVADASIQVERVERNGRRVSVTLYNNSSVPLTLKKVKENDPNIAFFRQVEIKPHSFLSFNINETMETKAERYALNVEVSNFWIAPNKALPLTLEVVESQRLSKQK
jgi:3',5'-nucleoside bisphosphate phosphatase